MTALRRGTPRVAAALLVAGLVVPAAGSHGMRRQAGEAPSADARIHYYAARVAAHPRLYPAWVELGRAYLDTARETLDPGAVARARRALRRSLAIQPSFDAFKAMAALSSFTHRFRDGVRWGHRALAAWPVDAEVRALLVEAHLGLGELDAAARLLGARSAGREHFYDVAARGRWQAASGRAKDAARSFRRAAALAHAADATTLAAWAEVSAAGVWIDAARPARAQAHLAAAARLDPGSRRLRVHQAEALEAQGRWDAALAAYEGLLAEREDPEVHRRAAAAARRLSAGAHARLHFRAAERGFRAIIASGEVYALEGLARLYGDAGVRLTEALVLATRNLEHKRDAGARATLDYVRARLANARTGRAATGRR